MRLTTPARAPFAGVLVLLVAALAACGDDDTAASRSPDEGTPHVVVTTTILGDVVSSIVGDAASVEVLMPAGADPHDVEPSARQVAGVRDAALVIANGLGLEAGFADALDAAADDGVPVLELAPRLDPIPFGGDHEHGSDDGAPDGDDQHHGDHGDGDPHFWHDPLRMADAVGLIADALVDAVPERGDGSMQERADALVAELEALDAEIESILGVVPDERRILVTNHESLGYLAHRYDFEVLGAVVAGGDTLAEPSAADIAELAEEIERHDAPAVFVDSTAGTSLAEAVAAEAGGGVEVVTLHTGSLGEPASGADTYAGMLRTNAQRIAEALR